MSNDSSALIAIEQKEQSHSLLSEACCEEILYLMTEEEYPTADSLSYLWNRITVEHLGPEDEDVVRFFVAYFDLYPNRRKEKHWQDVLHTLDNNNKAYSAYG